MHDLPHADHGRRHYKPIAHQSHEDGERGIGQGKLIVHHFQTGARHPDDRPRQLPRSHEHHGQRAHDNALWQRTRHEADRQHNRLEYAEHAPDLGRIKRSEQYEHHRYRDDDGPVGPFRFRGNNVGEQPVVENLNGQRDGIPREEARRRENGLQNVGHRNLSERRLPLPV